MSSESHPIEAIVAQPGDTDLGNLFHLHYPRIARAIARIVNDPSRAEELAADVFSRFLRTPQGSHTNPAGWLYRAAIRKGVDELRRQQRHEKYERLVSFFGIAPSPEQLHSAAQDQQHVRVVLATLKRRDAELLILRSEGLSYQETAEIVRLNETSIGTLLRRAQDAFRKEYVKRYGQPKF